MLDRVVHSAVLKEPRYIVGGEGKRIVRDAICIAVVSPVSTAAHERYMEPAGSIPGLWSYDSINAESRERHLSLPELRQVARGWAKDAVDRVGTTTAAHVSEAAEPGMKERLPNLNNAALVDGSAHPDGVVVAPGIRFGPLVATGRMWDSGQGHRYDDRSRC